MTGIDKQAKSITVSALWMSHFLVGARHAGVDVRPFMSLAGVDPERLKDPKARLSMDQVAILYRQLITAMDDEFAGLLERPIRLGSFRFLALYLPHLNTLGEALEKTMSFYNLSNNSFQYSLTVNQDECVLGLSRISGHQILDTYAVDLFLKPLHCFLGWLCNVRIILNRVRLDYSPPDYAEEYRYMYYGVPVLFDQDVISMSFNRRFLDYPIIQNEVSVESYVNRAPLDLFLRLDAGGEVTLAVRECVNREFMLRQLPPDLLQVSADLGYEPQTLRRRLNLENSSFNIIKSQVRRDIAIHCLGDMNMSVSQVGAKAGYSETSTFIRAFKSWTGCTPRQFRKGL